MAFRDTSSQELQFPMSLEQMCDSIRPLLSVYIDDEATPAEAALVEEHVAHCDRCSSDLAFLRLSHAVLSRRVDVPVPAALSARIAAATYGRLTLRERVFAFLRPAPMRLALGTALAAGIGLILFLPRPHERTGPAPVPSVNLARSGAPRAAHPDVPGPHAPAPARSTPRERIVAHGGMSAPHPDPERAAPGREKTGVKTLALRREAAGVRATAVENNIAVSEAAGPSLGIMKPAEGTRLPERREPALAQSEPRSVPEHIGTVKSVVASAPEVKPEPVAPVAPPVEVARNNPRPTKAATVPDDVPVRAISADGRISIASLSQPRTEGTEVIPVTFNREVASRRMNAGYYEPGQNAGGGGDIVKHAH